MKLYLDTCSLQRPLDDKMQPRVALEAEAILTILSLCEAGAFSLVSSEILRYEVGRNPYPQRKAFIMEILARTNADIGLSDAIETRALELQRRGFKALDALHLASAEAEQIDFFCTCDDRLLKRARMQSDIGVTVVSPLELAQEIVV
jgi:predicted nucleic acid-binding protein